MDNVAYAVKRSNTVRVVIIMLLSLAMAILIGSGMRGPVLHFAASSSAQQTAIPSKGNVVQVQPVTTGKLDQALRSMAATSVDRNRTEQVASNTKTQPALGKVAAPVVSGTDSQKTASK